MTLTAASLVLVLALQGMTDSRAMSVARSLWDQVAMIGHARNVFDTYWVKQVGVRSDGCKTDFTLLGSGPNTWDTAFAAVPMNIVKGPYSSTVTLRSAAWDDIAAVSLQFRLDGQPLGTEIANPAPGQLFNASIMWNTATVTNGIHSLCATARDASGNIGRGNAIVIEIDQSRASIATEIGPSFPAVR